MIKFGVATVKLAASAASPVGFGKNDPSHDPVGRTSPPQRPRSRDPVEPAGDGLACAQWELLGSLGSLDFVLWGGSTCTRLDHGLANPLGRLLSRVGGFLVSLLPR